MWCIASEIITIEMKLQLIWHADINACTYQKAIIGGRNNEERWREGEWQGVENFNFHTKLTRKSSSPCTQQAF